MLQKKHFAQSTYLIVIVRLTVLDITKSDATIFGVVVISGLRRCVITTLENKQN